MPTELAGYRVYRKEVFTALVSYHILFVIPEDDIPTDSDDITKKIDVLTQALNRSIDLIGEFGWEEILGDKMGDHWNSRNVARKITTEFGVETHIHLI